MFAKTRSGEGLWGTRGTLERFREGLEHAENVREWESGILGHLWEPRRIWERAPWTIFVFVPRDVPLTHGQESALGRA